MPTLLIVDDEPSVLYSLQRGLASDSLRVITADCARAALELVRLQRPDVVICDVRLPDMSGLDVYNQIRQIDPRLPVIIITAYSSTDTAIEAMKRGAFEYLLKPLDLPQLLAVVGKAIDLSRAVHTPATFEEEVPSDENADQIVGQSPLMHEVYKAIGRVAPQDVTVLLLGESGTGKELVARAIYQHSGRQQAPFLPINCAAIPEPLLESELFGHERGAFTGADRRRIGKFEQANGGTVFLDEVGDMPPPIQAKVLRLLQEQTFERVGGNETIRTNVRIIAATNQPLDRLVSHGRFRQDLLYRLNGFMIRLPPLRERLADLPLLVDYFRRKGNRDLGRQIVQISPEAMDCLLRHDWPGNIRELQSTIQSAMVRAPGSIVTADCLPESVCRPSPSSNPPAKHAEDLVTFIRQLVAAREPEIYQRVHAETDRLLLSRALEACQGNQLEAAELLGISRNTLRVKLKALGLAVRKELGSDEP